MNWGDVQYDLQHRIRIEFAEDPDIEIPSVFIARIEIPSETKTIAKPGIWIIRVNYHSEGPAGVEITTRTIIDNTELNFPLKFVNLESVYWILQRYMQIRMDKAIT